MLEPMESGGGCECVDETNGGVVPREFIPAVDRGILESLPSGVLAGYPVVDVKVTLFFGSYHDVDSNENAFRMAASMAFKEGMLKARPVLLEPTMSVEVETPEEYAGTVMGDLSSRRGMVQGMEDIPGGGKLIKAEVPLAEMFGYSTGLRSQTQGRATYSMEFKRYAEAPANVAEEIISARSSQSQVGTRPQLGRVLHFVFLKHRWDKSWQKKSLNGLNRTSTLAPLVTLTTVKLPSPLQFALCFLMSTVARSEEHTSELQSRGHLVCRLLLEKKKQ